MHSFGISTLLLFRVVEEAQSDIVWNVSRNDVTNELIGDSTRIRLDLLVEVVTGNTNVDVVNTDDDTDNDECFRDFDFEKGIMLSTQWNEGKEKKK